MAHSPHKRWKGCMLCKPHKIRGQGIAKSGPWSAVRKTGKRRRLRRNDLGDQLDD